MIESLERSTKVLKRASKASDLCTGTLFKLQLDYARKLGVEHIFILSAKHYLLSLDETVEPYNVPLNNMPVAERKAWANHVLEQMKTKTDPERDHFIVLAGLRYREFLLPSLKDYDVPLEHKRIGEQIQFLKGRLNE